MYKILSILLSFVLLSGLAVAVFVGVNALDRSQVETSRALLVVGAERIAKELASAGQELPDIAVALAAERELAGGLAKYIAAIDAADPEEERTAAQQARVDKATLRLDEIRERFRETRPNLAGVALTDDSGRVLHTDSSLFVHLANVELLPVEEPIRAVPKPAPAPADEEAEDDEAAEEPSTEAPTTLIAQVIADGAPRKTLVAASELLHVGAAPVYQGAAKKKIVGVALVETKLLTLPQVAGLTAVVFKDDRVLLGNAPERFVRPKEAQPTAFLAVPTQPNADVLGIFSIPLPAFVTGGHKAGLWAKHFTVTGAPGLHGYVFADLTPTYAQMYGLQALACLSALAVWLVFVVLVVFDGRGTRRGLTAISDFLGRLQQGSAKERSIDERRLPAEVRRLAKLINVAVANYVGGQVKALAQAPSVDQVILEARVRTSEAKKDEELPADFGNLDFQGIRDSGTLTVKPKPGDAPSPSPRPAPPAPPPDEVGEDSDGYDDTIAAAGTELFQSGPETKTARDVLGGVGVGGAEAMAALDQLDENAASVALEPHVFGGPTPRVETKGEPATKPATPTKGSDPAVVLLDEATLDDGELAEAELEDAIALEDDDDVNAPKNGRPVQSAAGAPAAMPHVTTGVFNQLKAGLDKEAASLPKVGAAPGAGLAASKPANGVGLPKNILADLKAKAPGAFKDVPKSGPTAGSPAPAPAKAVTPAPSAAAKPATKPAEAAPAANKPTSGPGLPSIETKPASTRPVSGVPVADVKVPATKPVTGAPPGPDAATAAHFREIYDAFVATRDQCGEKGELSFEKFVVRLEQSRDAVIQKHNCADVRFQVYVKNGKAALKAVPAK